MKVQLQPGQLSQIESLNFITAGNARFTIKNKKTGNRFTYRVRRPLRETPETTNVLFVSVLTGRENDHAYSYIGTLRQYNGVWRFSHGVKSHISENAVSVVAFGVVFNAFISLKREHPDLEIWHEGRCCRCGHPLTVPESIRSGIGPECANIRADHFRHR